MAENCSDGIMTAANCENTLHNGTEKSYDHFKSSLVIQLTKKKQKIVMMSTEEELTHSQKTERKKVSFYEHTTAIDTELKTPVEFTSSAKTFYQNGNLEVEINVSDKSSIQNGNPEVENDAHVKTFIQNWNPEVENDAHVKTSIQNGNPKVENDAHVKTSIQNGNPKVENDDHVKTSIQNGNSKAENDGYVKTSIENGNPEVENDDHVKTSIQNENLEAENDVHVKTSPQNGDSEIDTNVHVMSDLELPIDDIPELLDSLEEIAVGNRSLIIVNQDEDVDLKVEKVSHSESHELANKEITEDQQLNSFRDRYCESLRCQLESLKQISIPKARLAFVTEMVENSHHSQDSKVVCSAKESHQVEAKDEFHATGLEEKKETNIEQFLSELSKQHTEIDDGKDISCASILEEPESGDAVVDRSSILERKKELKRLWEKKMAEEQPQALAVGETIVVREEPKMNALANGSAKMMNGSVTAKNESHAKDASIVEEATIIDENNTNKGILKINGSTNLIEVDENSNIEEVIKQETNVEVQQVCDEANVVIETSVTETTEKIFTSTLQQTFVITKTEESLQVEKEEEAVEMPITQTSAENLEDQEDFEEIERRIEAEESMAQEVEFKEQDLVSESIGSSADELDLPKELGSHMMLEDPEEKGEHALSSNADSLETLDRHVDEEEEEDFVCVGDAVFAGDLELTDKDSIKMNGYTAPSAESIAQNGEQEEKTFDDQFVLDTRELESPSSDRIIEKHGKKSSMMNTEQPYSTCTTETKIAMEIREMREREEELKLMRERQAQISPLPPSPTQQIPKAAPLVTKATAVQKSKQPSGYISHNTQKVPTTPGYRVSSVFGHRPASQSAKDETKLAQRNFSKETPVEREIRLAKDREEELRKQKGLPPREDDSFVKPSQVKSAQAKVFGKIVNSENSRLIATAKIQHEIEEQTMRELALRESGSIQTLSSERTDSKVTKLKPIDTPECVSPTFVNGNSLPYINGNSNGHISPDILSKRSTPSPTGSNSSYTIASRTNPLMGASGINKGISMQKFIASRGKESTFSASRNGPFVAKAEYYTVQDTAAVARAAIPEPGKLKRTLSVESKIQQEIMEMKQREEELKLLHSGHPPALPAENGENHNGTHRSPMDYQNGQTETEETCPRKSNLIAQWEQMIQNAA